MNIKTLIFTIIGIFAVTTASYFVLSPIATNYLYPKSEVKVTLNNNTETASTQEVTNTQQQTTQTTATQTQTTEQTQTTKNGYTLADVANHPNSNSCWTAISGNVYDLTSYIKRHPGGSANVLRICGKDGTSDFMGQHGGQSKPEKILAGFLIGPLTQ